MSTPTPTNMLLDATGDSPAEGWTFISAVIGARLPILMTDPRVTENPIVFANRAFMTLTGYEPTEVLGRNCRFLQGPGTDRTSVATLRQAVEGRQEISVRLLNYRKDGSSFWNDLHISPVYAADGELIYFFACQQDVSRWQETEDDLERRPGVSGAVALAALRRWRELEQLASDAARNLAGREIAFAGTLPMPSSSADRLLVAQLREAATRARLEAFAMLDGK
ncbi:MAG: PAS domain-containing protein [Variovorax sp.]|nr:MAG: PAS domain-containing protein [Variovorax sp.]